jgi:hypothetical protein
MEYLSTTSLAKQCNAEPALLFEDMHQAGWITRQNEKWVLTHLGAKQGGVLKHHHKFGEYIAWPENIDLRPLDPDNNINFINTTVLAGQFNISSKRMNLVLSELGWIEKHLSGWLITKQGYAIGGRQCEHETSGSMFVVWPDFITKNKDLIAVFQEEKKKEFTPEPVQPVKATPTTQTSTSFREKFEAKHRTKDGHYVRSRAELLIDNILYDYSLSHAYERKLPIEEDMYCDFYLNKGNVYIEYWGMEDDPKYAERKKVKQELYKKYDFKLIELNDDDILNLDDVLPKKLLKFEIKVY